MNTLALSSLTITEARRRLRAKQISAEELTRACIERTEQIDKDLNAVVHRNFYGALEEAKRVDSSGDLSAPLSGIPYFAKDVFCEKGIETTACSNILRSPTASASGGRGAGKDYRPPFDSTTTKRLRAAGAISMGKTNTDEFTMGGSTETSCYGVTKNPWDTSRVAGGSSGGSAAAVAADECLFALGTDTGGSIRQPAAFCGISGLRVTYGRTSRYGAMSMASSLDTTGPLGKSVADIALILRAIAGKDPLDGTTADVPVPDYSAALTGNVKGLTIGIPKEYFLPGMNAEVESAVRESIKTLENLGAKTKQISLPHTEFATPTYYVICPSEVSSNMARYDGIRYGHSVKDPKNLLDYYERVRTEGFGKEVKRRIMIGTYALSAGYYDAYYRQAQRVRTLIRRDFDEAFQSVDVILSPVTPTPAFKIGAHEGDPVSMYLEDIFLCAQVMAGIPALSVPCGATREGLPIGLQIMGKQFAEATVLRVGDAFEHATQWHTRKPKL